MCGHALIIHSSVAARNMWLRAVLQIKKVLP